MKEKNEFNDLLQLYNENKFAHAYLFETNSVSKCFEDVKSLIKEISYKTNCFNAEKFQIDEMIDNESLPSVIIIRPDGKNIKKEAIENLKNAFSMKPIYTTNNIYIILEPEKMNSTAYNKLLKFLEEPEDNILGFFITNNKDYVANTIISRCECLTVSYKDINNLENEKNDKIRLLVDSYIEAIENHNLFINHLVVNKNLESREDVILFMELIFTYYHGKINTSKSNNSILKKIRIVEKYLEQLNYNVNTNLLLDSFVIEMGGINE